MKVPSFRLPPAMVARVVRALTPTPAYLTPRARLGAGRKTLYTIHKAVGRTKYMPHQGEQEIARRQARMEG